MSDNVAPRSTPRQQGTSQLEPIEYLMWRAKMPRSSAYALVTAGRVPGVVRIGRSIRIDRDKLEAWIANGGDKE